MINFGSAADKCFSYERANGRYKGPPVRLPIISSNDDGNRTPVNFSPDPQIAATNRKSRTKFPKKANPSRPSKKRPHSRPHKSSCDLGTHDAFYTNWDLVPPSPDRAFPIWDSYTTVSDSFRRNSHKTLKELLRNSIVENSPTAPSPHDLAVINTLQKKLESWEKAEEDMFRRRRGWYCSSKHVEDRAWSSWALTQNRGFGSAVWRWLRLENWDGVQTPQMKGLWHQAVHGDWDRYSLPGGERSADVLQEWKWNQGLPKEIAQEEFITAAETMGIPPVRWENDDRPHNNLLEDVVVDWTPNMPRMITDGTSNYKVCPVSRKLLARSAISSPSTGRVTVGDASQGSVAGSTGAGVFANLGEAFWGILQQWNSCKADPSSRSHARSWNIANQGAIKPLCTLANY